MTAIRGVHRAGPLPLELADAARSDAQIAAAEVPPPPPPARPPARLSQTRRADGCSSPARLRAHREASGLGQHARARDIFFVGPEKVERFSWIWKLLLPHTVTLSARRGDGEGLRLRGVAISRFNRPLHRAAAAAPGACRPPLLLLKRPELRPH